MQATALDWSLKLLVRRYFMFSGVLRDPVPKNFLIFALLLLSLNADETAIFQHSDMVLLYVLCCSAGL